MIRTLEDMFVFLDGRVVETYDIGGRSHGFIIVAEAKLHDTASTKSGHFGGARGGSPQRELRRVAITTYGDDVATANAEFFREGGDRRGRQSQTWVRFADGWKIVAAHVSIEGATS